MGFYYNRITHILRIDALDWFLMSAFFGSLVALRLKQYLSKDASMERLKNSIIEKSGLIINDENRRILVNPKTRKIKKIYNVGLSNCGGGS